MRTHFERTEHADMIASRAVELLLADVDTYTDWLSGHCARVPRVELGFVNTRPDTLMQLAETMSVIELVALSLYPHGGAMAAAQRELSERYVNAHADYLARLEAELMGGV